MFSGIGFLGLMLDFVKNYVCVVTGFDYNVVQNN